MIRTFEYDDYPLDRDNLLSILDRGKKKYPNFKATIFAIPSMMTEENWQPLLDRAEWIQVGIHGFDHIKGECRRAKFVRRNRGRLDALVEDERYAAIFKAPWYGYSEWMLEELAKRDLTISVETLHRWPRPIPEGYKIWCRGDRRRIEPYASTLAHPSTNARGPAKKQAISSFRVRKWQRTFSPDDQWAYCLDMARPALLKLNLGCEKDVWDGWVCMDNRQTKPEVVIWDFNDMLPYADCTADIILTSHTLQHLSVEDYPQFFLECWRVLRPQGVLRLHQDDADSGYTWRKVGSQSRIGEIKSGPSKSNTIKALDMVGFTISHKAAPGSTLSPHKDVFQGDNRMTHYSRGTKFYLEAIKDISELIHKSNYKLPKHDVRATKSGRYRLRTDDN